MNEYIPPRDEDFNCLIEGERVCERELERERERERERKGNVRII